ncbi:hypothetical protein HDU83_006447 [Entophlyctis luteolus]|nr:hypothetical protein HDU83_006447 [Entophlyctis luteolus]
MPLTQLILVTVCRSSQPDDALNPGNLTYAACVKLPGVQEKAAQWSLLLSLGEQVPSVLVLVVAGSLIDSPRFGPKRAMMGSAIAVLLASVACLNLSMDLLGDTSSVFALWLVFLARVAEGIAGGKFVFRMAATAYIADCCKPNLRTKYFLYLDAFMATAITLGPLSAGSLVKYFGYERTFMVTTVVALLLLFHSICVPDSKRGRDSYRSETDSEVNVINFRKSFLSTVQTLVSISRNSDAACLVAILTIIGILISSTQVFFVWYPSKIFGWDALDYGKFSFISASQKIIWLSFLLPTFFKFMGTADNVADKVRWEIRVLRFGLLFATVGEICYGLAWNGTLFTLCTILASMSCFAGPTIRSLLSSSVPATHQGRLFCTIQILDSVATIYATTGLNLVYQATVNGAFPQTVFFCMAALIGSACCLALLGVRQKRVERMKLFGGDANSTPRDRLGVEYDGDGERRRSSGDSRDSIDSEVVLLGTEENNEV